MTNNPWQSWKIKKGETPSVHLGGTEKRLRDIPEGENPDDKTQREEGVKEASRIFFSRETPRQNRHRDVE